jgi:hypothetical protein
VATLWVRPEELENPESPYATDAAISASYLLWALSGRRYSNPRTIVENYECPGNLTPGIPHPTLLRGRVYNLCAGCGASYTLRLRNRPVLKLESVVYQDEELDPSDYEIVNRAVLRPRYRRYWNMCNDGITVRYRYGQPPPVSGRRAARFLANQFVCAWSGGEDCKLPAKMSSISREGVTIDVQNTNDFLDRGLTGVYEVDLFLKTINPGKSTHPSRVFSPDIPRAARLAHVEYVPGDDDLAIFPGEIFTKDFTMLPGPDLDGIDWKPQGEIQFGPGDAALVLGDDYWTYITGGVRLTIPANETLFQSVTGGTFNLYAVRIDDAPISSLSYTSKVFVTTHVA